MGRVSRTMGFPVSGQTGVLLMSLLLEGQEDKIRTTVIGELYIECAVGMGDVINVLPHAVVVV